MDSLLNSNLPAWAILCIAVVWMAFNYRSSKKNGKSESGSIELLTNAISHLTEAQATLNRLIEIILSMQMVQHQIKNDLSHLREQHDVKDSEGRPIWYTNRVRCDHVVNELNKALEKVT